MTVQFDVFRACTERLQCVIGISVYSYFFTIQTYYSSLWRHTFWWRFNRKLS